MWFYFYLLSTSFYFQQGWTMYGFTNKPSFNLSEVPIQHNYSEPLKYVGVYQMLPDTPKQAVYNWIQLYYRTEIDDYGVEWVRMVPEEYEQVFTNLSISYIDIIHTKIHDEL